MTNLIDLAARVEGLSGAEWDVACDIVQFLYDERIPIPSYGGPINYDPMTWQQRHGLDPTASLDAAMQLVPEGWWPSMMIQRRGNEGIWYALRNWEAAKVSAKAATPALALTAAALRARGL